MTSGVPDYVPALEPKILEGGKQRDPRLVAARAGRHGRRQAARLRARTAWNYSSTNYILAGLIIERVTGNRLGDELEQRIIEPLRLRHTSFPVDTTADPGPPCARVRRGRTASCAT